MLVESSDGVLIGYETVGRGRPLVLLHGFFGDRRTWQAAGYVDVLADDFQLVLIDARGHGDSGAPHDPASYRLRPCRPRTCAGQDLPGQSRGLSGEPCRWSVPRAGSIR